MLSTLSDDDIERLLSGARPESDEASRFVVLIDLIRAEVAFAPSEMAVARVATEAAKLARSTFSSGFVTYARPRGRRAGLSLRPQLVVAAAAFLVLFGATGVAVAANGAAPGDALYGIDRALERIGIGAGHVQERLDEANVLLSEGKATQALEHAAEALDEAAAAAEGNDLEEARSALVEAAGRLLETDQGGANELLVWDNVSILLDYLRENLGESVGADGKEFGQDVADLARGITSERDGADPTPKPAEDNGKNDDEVGRPSEGAPGNGIGNGAGGGNGEGNGLPDGSPPGTAPD